MASDSDGARSAGLSRAWLLVALAIGLCLGFMASPTLPGSLPALAPWPPQRGRPVERQVWVSANRSDPCVSVPHHLGSRGGCEYHASQLEKLWSETPRRGKICEVARDEEQLRMVKMWLNYSAAAFKEPREPSQQEAEVLSYFTFQQYGAIVKRYIEPLQGIGRHPHAVCHQKSNGALLDDIRYLIPENGCREGMGTLRGVFFDLGFSSINVSEDVRSFERSGSGAGPSVPLFYNMYKERCIDFEEIFAWKAGPLDHTAWWAPLPDEIRKRVHFYNLPVEENRCPESPRGDFKKVGSFLNILPGVVSVEDYVVVKVDDQPPALAIVEALAHLPELSQLVDELYFEHHYYFDGQDLGWGISDDGRDVDSAMNLMQRLREAGIRSHFWI